MGAKDPNGITKRLGLEQRAELIARSELAAAYSAGTIRRAQAEGLAYVRVLASNDERVSRLTNTSRATIDAISPSRPIAPMGR